MATGTSASTRNGGVRLVVVESPSKAKTISGYLGDGYIVESSVGHIRDLPRGAADVPAKYKGEPWARLGVDTEHGFEPLYVVSPEKKAQVAKLRLIGDKLELTVEVMQQKGGSETTETYQMTLPHNIDGIIINLPAYMAGLPEEAYLEEFIPAPPTEEDDEEAPNTEDDMGLGDF